jgi:3-deoxy-D-manno-octulosonic-acid transferase
MIGLLYRGATALAAPAAPFYLGRRAAAGKEDRARLGERYGRASRPRPTGALGWLHGASVGEALSLLPLMQAIAARRPGISFLVTSGTLTSAGLLAGRLPANAIHQFPPLDAPAWCERFLAHWRPDFGLFVESELWPNLIAAAARHGLPLALVNARMSERSFRRWQWAGGWAREILAAFRLVLAPEEEAARRFRRLGARAVAVTGNLKSASPPLACDETTLARFRAAIGDRPTLLFASTHEGEETLAAALHRALAGGVEGLLTIVAPRHPARTEAIARDLARIGLRLARRARNELPAAGTELYLADSLGELGLFYRLADLVVMGGSFASAGGHNPLEPARLERAILAGPDIANFADLYRRLETAGGCRILDRASALPEVAKTLLSDASAREAMARAAREFADAEAAVLDRVMAALDPFLERALARPAA